MTEYLEINPKRLEYLMALYDLKKGDILERINSGRKRKITEKEVFDGRIRTSILRQIDKEFFEKELFFYTDSINLSTKDSGSIFFRKQNFNSALTCADRWRVSAIEEEMHHLHAIMKLSGYELARKLEKYSVRDDPVTVANVVREQVDFGRLQKYKKDRDYLKSMIEALADMNVIVIEFTEAENSRKRVSWEGLFLAPNAIAIKRQQHAFKREIFTLAHELGHYLLDSEEIDANVFEQPLHDELQRVERWCNDFAYQFILGDTASEVERMFSCQPDIHNGAIAEISSTHRISRLAIYTNLATRQSIGWDLHAKLKAALDGEYAESQQKLTRSRKCERALQMPKPIYSPIEEDIYRHAFFAGSIEEIDVINRFKPNMAQIKNGYFDKFLYGETLQ